MDEEMRRLHKEFKKALKESRQQDKERIARMTPEQRKRERKFQKELSKVLDEKAKKVKELEETLSPEERKLRSKITSALSDWADLAWRHHRFGTVGEATKWAKEVQAKARKDITAILKEVGGNKSKIKKVLLPDEWEGGLFGGFKDYLRRYKSGGKIVVISIAYRGAK